VVSATAGTSSASRELSASPEFVCEPGRSRQPEVSEEMKQLHPASPAWKPDVQKKQVRQLLAEALAQD
jgi:hypothetical protein